jgi:EmrB/QacA subfamily drug resistance transporter
VPAIATTASSTDRPVRAALDPRWALLVAILGSGMAFLDSTVVNVALPVIQRDLGMTVDLIQWVVEAYALLLSSLVLVGGALGDRLGRRRVFSVGVMLFALASAACGLATGPLPLGFARAFQGFGAAFLVPGSLALISAAYGDKTRGAAIGTWSAFSAVTAAFGPVAGGWVVAHASWRWVFFFNVPIAIAVVVMARLRVAETRDANAAKQVDWLGASLASLGLGLIVTALLESDRLPGFWWVLGLLLLGMLTLVGFVWVEARRTHPMVPLSLFRSRTFSGTNLLTLLLYAALGGALFFVPFNLIQVQHYSPAAAGASLLPFVVFISTMSRWAGGLSARVGARLPLVVGPLIAAAGFALLALPTTGGTYWTTFFPGVVVLGAGMGLTVAPLTAAVMGSVGVDHAGVASGINNAVARAAGLLAVAALGVVLVARFNRVLDSRLAALSLPPSIVALVDGQRSKLVAAEFPAPIEPGTRDQLRAAFDASFVSGFRTVMLTGALLAALSALAAFLLVEARPRSYEEGP